MFVIALVDGFYIMDNKENSRNGRTRGDMKKLDKQYYEAFLHSTIPFVLARLSDARLIEVNEAFEKLVGYLRDELIGRTAVELGIWFNPSDQEQVLQILRAGRKMHDREYWFRTRNGQVILCQCSAEVVELDGESCALVTLNDITACKQSEQLLQESQEQLRRLSDNLANGMVYQINSGPDGHQRRFTYLSPAIERLHGLKQEDVQRDPSLLYGQVIEKHRALVAEREAHAFATRTTLDVEVQVRLPSGDIRWRSFISSPRTLADGSIVWDGIELDITDRKEAEDSLHESQQEIQAIYECLNDGICVVDPETRRVLRVNKAMCRLFGYSEEEFINKTIEDMHPPASMPLVRQQFEDLVKGKKHVSEKIPCVRVDGSVFFVEIGAANLELRGRPCAVGIFRDMTERLRTEEIIRKNKERLKLAMDIGQMGEWDYDFLSNTVRHSIRFDRIFGYDTPPKNWSYEIFLEHVVPADRPSVELAIRRSDEAGCDLNYQCRIIRRNGEMRWIWISARTHRNENGEPMWRTGVVQDITEQKKAEEAVQRERDISQAVIKALPGILYLVDETEHYVLWNRNLEELTGYSAAEMSQCRCSDFVPESERGLLAEATRKVFEEGAATLEASVLRKDGTTKPYYLTGIRIDLDGRPHLVGVGFDVSRRKQAEEEREYLQVQLRQAQKLEAVGLLAGGISHEFNNLLTVIIGNTDLALLATPDNSSQADDSITAALNEIRQAAERAAILTRQLLTFSRKQVPVARPTDIGQVIMGMENMLRQTIGETIRIRILSDPGKYTVMIDPAQIEQVILNLAINARDAMPGGGQLTIQIDRMTFDDKYVAGHLDAKVGPHVMVVVGDTGTGMDDHILDHLFDPFFTTKPVGKGSGLGLSIVYGIVRQAGGHITVDSRPGAGSRFCLFFPMAQEAASIEERPLPSQRVGGNETILLCEDEPLVRHMARRTLEGRGYHVIEAENGIEGLKEVAEYKGRIHLLVTDLVMPRMDGHELAVGLKKDHPGIKVLFMSGYAANVLGDKVRSLGEFEFLQKPFMPDQLLLYVRKVLDKP